MQLHWFDEILPGKLFCGEMPFGIDDLTELQDNGINAILTVQEENENTVSPLYLENFNWIRLPIPDIRLGGIPTEKQLRDGAKILHDWIDQKKYVVYVHCYAGQERSPLVCMSYLILWKGMEMESAISFVKEKRKLAHPSIEQLGVLRSLTEQEMK